MDCENCVDKRHQAEPVSFAVFESTKATLERSNKRMFWALMVVIVLFMASWAGFIWYESQWEDISTEITQEVDTGEGDAYVAGIGDVYYGESETNSQDTNP